MTSLSLERTLEGIEAVNPNWMRLAENRQLQLTKPPRSLGRLEEIANRCVAIQATLSPSVDKPRILLFAGDHGVCEEGVSPYPQSVTTQMVINFANGGAAINALAKACQLELIVVDVGLAHPLPAEVDVVRRQVAAGTRNFCKDSAMTS